MRARYPDVQGEIERDGVRVGYDVYGEPGRPCLVLLTSWAIVHMRQWKFQVPYLSSPGTSASSPSRAGGTAAQTGPTASRHTPTGSTSPTPSP
jgi:hypothetical protein